MERADTQISTPSGNASRNRFISREHDHEWLKRCGPSSGSFQIVDVNW